MTTTRRKRVLVVDDDGLAAASLVDFLREEGFEAVTASDGAEALSALDEAAQRPAGAFAVMICDVSLPKVGGLEVLKQSSRRHPATAVVMLTGYGTIETAVTALRLGAADFLTKPLVDEELRLAMTRALRQHTLAAENSTLKAQLDEKFGLEQIVGSDHRMMKIYELIESVAPSRTTVLMTGESGTGKSLIAHCIHRMSPRRDAPFVEISCGSIPETLLESELFGHVKGAFTGAHADKVGRFLAADGGTIFLDEINSASPGMQLKLLRVLQERRFEPVGSTETIEVDARVVLATNQDLLRLVKEGSFRQDLYYRINVVKIEVPPLRERPGDVMLLAEHFLARQGREMGKQLTGFSEEARSALLRYAYPGNVRELQNVIERAAVLSKRPRIGLEDLPVEVAEARRSERTESPAADGEAEGQDGAWNPMSLEEAMREPERRIILRALRSNDWNRQATAEQLGINRTTLYKKMKSLGIDPVTPTGLAAG
jgi:DNA-binding NtrC family response regulator